MILFSLFSGPLTRVVTRRDGPEDHRHHRRHRHPDVRRDRDAARRSTHIPVTGVIFVGVVNGTGGGLLRDVLVRDVPAILRPGQFVSLLLLLACVLFVGLKQYPQFTHPGGGLDVDRHLLRSSGPDGPLQLDDPLGAAGIARRRRPRRMTETVNSFQLTVNSSKKQRPVPHCGPAFLVNWQLATVNCHHA